VGARTSEALRSVAERLDRVAASGLPRVANGAALIALTAAGGVAAAGAMGVDVRALPAASLATVFAVAAAGKVLAPGQWRDALAAYRLGLLDPPALVGVPLAEAAVVALVITGAPAQASVLALALLVAFSGGILRARTLHGSLVPCGCFGRARARDFRILLGRNVALAMLSAGVLLTGSAFPLLDWARSPGGGEVLPAALALAGLALAAWLGRMATAALRRQPG
jgi:hypothetical protein